jgi:predicted O-linked N-acetylglucosamine transferase (SPINDLY family)
MTPDQQSHAQAALSRLNAGDASGAWAAFEALLDELPHQRDLILLAARSARLCGRAEAARALLLSHLDRASGDIDAQYEMALADLHLGQSLRAAQRLARISALAPMAVEILAPLGDSLMHTPFKRSALACFDHANRLRPDQAGFAAAAGAAAMDLGLYQQAIEFSRLALAIDRNQVHAWVNLGNALLQLGQAQESCQALRSALDLQPQNDQIRTNLIDALRAAQRLDDAWSLCPAETRFEPLMARRASMLQELGRADQALPIWRQLAEHDDEFIGRYLSALSLADEPSALSVLAETRSLTSFRVTPPISSIHFRPKAKIKLAYFSGDFRAHSVARNIESVIKAHDRSAFEIILYSSVAKPDWFTQRFANSADHMIQVTNYSDDELADRVRTDQIDIFVQLAARFDDNRLMLGRRRMAPVQVSFHDVATSGMEHIDYLIADRTLHPPNSTEAFSERVIHLPRFYVHTPVDDLPRVNELPMAAHEHGPRAISFGSFNNPTKFSASTLTLWRRVLQSLPQAKLYLRYASAYDSLLLREHVLGSLEADRRRIIFLTSGKLTTADHMALYHHIDISLDTLPFSGSTTTYESLLMGVPVLTLPGSAMVGRWTMSMLQAVGLSEFIAQSADDYIAKANTLAAAPKKLSAIRSGLRERVINSQLNQPTRQARHLERAYRQILAAYRSRSAD